ncbi:MULTISPECIES: Pycsar system effector family protein [Sphingobium]|uniref:Pycsar system effector family protein n=1 Tax=Sphingobium TaxID=165695 RepID=UPI00159C849D|nr:Pycsar system effector family protein [Sphingobium sp. 15-1]
MSVAKKGEGEKMDATNVPVPNAIHLLRTAVQTNMQLSQMADQKANMLIGASMVIFTLCVAQLRSGALVWPVAALAVGVFLAATCAILAVLPSVSQSRGGVGDGDNLLFFGIFTSLSEAEFSDRMMALVSDDDALYRAMLRDMYQNGQVLQRRKYRWLGYAYRLFLTGVVMSFAALVVDLGLGWR